MLQHGHHCMIIPAHNMAGPLGSWWSRCNPPPPPKQQEPILETVQAKHVITLDET